ncbi:hypothetical protein M9X92_011358 [Pyricularia oryzae]|nr:hypothetical protein M9X92_011358 [Pyricularia oryzae]
MRLQIITVATCFVYGALTNLAEAHNQKISARGVKNQTFGQCVDRCYATRFYGMDIPPTPSKFKDLYRHDAHMVFIDTLCHDHCAVIMEELQAIAIRKVEEKIKAEREAEREAERKAQRKAQRKAEREAKRKAQRKAEREA